MSNAFMYIFDKKAKLREININNDAIRQHEQIL